MFTLYRVTPYGRERVQDCRTKEEARAVARAYGPRVNCKWSIRKRLDLTPEQSDAIRAEEKAFLRLRRAVDKLQDFGSRSIIGEALTEYGHHVEDLLTEFITSKE